MALAVHVILLSFTMMSLSKKRPEMVHRFSVVIQIFSHAIMNASAEGMTMPYSMSWEALKRQMTRLQREVDGV